MFGTASAFFGKSLLIKDIQSAAYGYCSAKQRVTAWCFAAGVVGAGSAEPAGLWVGSRLW